MPARIAHSGHQLPWLLPAISFGQTFATDFEQLLTTGQLNAAIDLAIARVKTAPEDVTYDGLRQVLAQFHDRLAIAEATLAPRPDQRIDQISAREILAIAFDLTFHNLFPRPQLASHGLAEQSALALECLRTAPKYFDCPEFDSTRHPDETDKDYRKRSAVYDKDRAAAKAVWEKSPQSQTFAAAKEEIAQMSEMLWLGGIADSIAFIHVLDWPVVQPDRMKEARQHLLQMISLSRENWRRIKAETDDKVEWLPGPQQTSLMENLRVTASRVQGWGIFLNEFEAVLNATRLIPHWRIASENRGLNLRRLFDEPAALDLVLLLQGSAALPYLEDGETVRISTVAAVFNLMGSGLIGYFFWFN